MQKHSQSSKEMQEKETEEQAQVNVIRPKDRGGTNLKNKEKGEINAGRNNRMKNFEQKGNSYRGKNWMKNEPRVQNDQRVQYNQQREGDRCYNCGRTGHYAYAKQCPALGQKCGNCGIKGHFAVTCRRRKKVSAIMEEEEESDEERVFLI
ncbi:protein lin-28 homolog A-like [Ambystoma mexicanum]|uniref:protein lin-28 homolog A-like n=1 Tax=Ambystoma mexicanum TaxID=8296 RepID=UPI0037E895F0